MILEWDEMSFLQKTAARAMSTRSFLDFTKLWFNIITGDKLIVNWHHEMMASKIDDLIAGRLEERNLIVNIPPGGTKTEFFSVHLPAYVNTLVQDGKLSRFRNLNLSYADTLVKRNSRRTREIIASREYQELFPCMFGVNQAEEWEVVNERGRVVGQTVSKSSGGQVTGGRGGYHGPQFSGMIMLDDFDKPADMFSETKRSNMHSLLTNTVRSRRGDKSKEHPTPIVSIQQRLHTEDSTGFMIGGGMGIKFHHVSIPALINEDYINSLEEPWRTKCWDKVKDTDSREVGGVRYWSYWPEMEHVDQLVDLWEKDEYTFVSQYMQNPRALTGGLIDTDWFPRYSKLPPLTHRAIYVDTNSGKVKDYNDYTVFTLAGKDKDGNVYIIDCERGRWDPEDLLKKAEEVWNRWKPFNPKRPAPLRYMAIEDKQAGQGLITTLKKRAKIPIREIPRGTDQNKLIRCQNSIPWFKTGKVWLPEDAKTKVEYWDSEIACTPTWLPAMLAEMGDFSADDSHRNDDMCDTIFDVVEDQLINNTSGGYRGWL